MFLERSAGKNIDKEEVCIVQSMLLERVNKLYTNIFRLPLCTPKIIYIVSVCKITCHHRCVQPYHCVHTIFFLNLFDCLLFFQT